MNVLTMLTGTQTKMIMVEVKTNYGSEMIYPVCDQAKTFANLCGTTTLTRTAIKLIKQLGYTVEVKQPVFDL